MSNTNDRPIKEVQCKLCNYWREVPGLKTPTPRGQCIISWVTDRHGNDIKVYTPHDFGCVLWLPRVKGTYLTKPSPRSEGQRVSKEWKGN